MRVPQAFLLHAHYPHLSRLVAPQFHLHHYLYTVFAEFLRFDTPSDVITMANTGFAASFWSHDYAGGKLCGAVAEADDADRVQDSECCLESCSRACRRTSRSSP